MNNRRKYISIVIPTYEMHGFGKEFLRHSFDILTQQTFRDFDVVISDHSKNNDIQDLCTEYMNRLDIHYFRNEEKRGNSPANVNNGLKHAMGALIKVLFQDDFLYTTTSLQEIVDTFDMNKDYWLVTASEHTRDGKTFFRTLHPTYNDKMHLGKNTISSPSVLTIKNENTLFFDEQLVWSMDCDYYRRCYDTFGPPKILNKINVVNRVGGHQISTNRLEEDLKEKEYVYILRKYKEKHPKLLLFLFRSRKHINWLKRTLKKIYKKII